MENYGEELLEIVRAYRKKHGIDKVVLPEPKKPSKKSPSIKKESSVFDTKKTSFDMFNKGLTISQIAKERGLVTSTIETHLSFFVEKGKLDINRLLSIEKQQAIEKELAQDHNNSLSQVKAGLGNDYTYGEIRMMIARGKYQDAK